MNMNKFASTKEVCTRARTRTSTRTHAHAQTHIHTHARTRTQTHTHTHTHTRTHIHTHTHTHTHKLPLALSLPLSLSLSLSHTHITPPTHSTRNRTSKTPQNRTHIHTRKLSLPLSLSHAAKPPKSPEIEAEESLKQDTDIFRRKYYQEQARVAQLQVTWLSNMIKKSVCLALLIHECTVTQQYDQEWVWRDSAIWWQNASVWHYSFMSVPWLSNMSNSKQASLTFRFCFPLLWEQESMCVVFTCSWV